MIAIRAAAWAAACLVLAGCAARGPLIPSSLAPSAQRSVELTDTPFFPQREMQCGPASLAMVLNASGVATTPDELTPLVFIPARRGSLQVELQAAPRKFSRLAYVIEPDLDAILEELAAGRPVLVLHNYGLPFLPRWHYAVVVGYDAERDSIVMRSGTTRRQVLSAANFMRAWDNGDRWAIVILRPGELPVRASAARYLETAAAFQRVASPSDAAMAFEAAIDRWPEEPVAWIGRGTARYRSGELRAAASDYFAALKADATHIGARNNLAMVLVELGCVKEARRHMERIGPLDPGSALSTAVQDTRERIEKAAASPVADHSGATCASFVD